MRWGYRQIHPSIDKTTGVARPCLTAAERIATTGANRPVVPALLKEAARFENVLKWSAIDADLQYAAIKSLVQSIVMPEGQNRTCPGLDRARR